MAGIPNIKMLVDRGAVLDAIIKSAQNELESIKPKVRSHAMLISNKNVMGEEYNATAVNDTKRSVKPKKVLDLFSKLTKKQLSEIATVSVPKLLELFKGDDAKNIEKDFVQTETKEYSRVSFSPVDSRKMEEIKTFLRKIG